MKLQIKQLLIFLFLFFTTNIFFTSFSLAENNLLTTRVLVILGEVMCFEMPKDLVRIERKGETAIGTFIEYIDKETCLVDIKGKRVRCYISEETRQNTEIKPHSGIRVYLIKNTRLIEQTEWDIVSVGKIVKQWQIYSNGMVTDIGIGESAKPVAEIAAPVAPSATNTITNPSALPPVEDVYARTGMARDDSFPSVIIAEPAPFVALTITTSSTLPGGAEGTAYSTTVSASGGTSPYTWSLVSGSLPSGLSLSSGGVISGTPSSNSRGTYTFTIKVTDDAGNTATKEFSLKIGYYKTALDDYVWVTSSDDFVARVNKTDLSATNISVGNNPNFIAVDDTYVWVTNNASGFLTRIKKSDLTTTSIDVGGIMRWGGSS